MRLPFVYMVQIVTYLLFSNILQMPKKIIYVLYIWWTLRLLISCIGQLSSVLLCFQKKFCFIFITFSWLFILILYNWYSDSLTNNLIEIFTSMVIVFKSLILCKWRLYKSKILSPLLNSLYRRQIIKRKIISDLV